MCTNRPNHETRDCGWKEFFCAFAWCVHSSARQKGKILFIPFPGVNIHLISSNRNHISQLKLWWKMPLFWRERELSWNCIIKKWVSIPCYDNFLNKCHILNFHSQCSYFSKSSQCRIFHVSKFCTMVNGVINVSFLTVLNGIQQFLGCIAGDSWSH